jgi:hypothetical protein
MLASLLPTASHGAAPTAGRTITALRVDRPPVIDGHLDEAA